MSNPIILHCNYVEQGQTIDQMCDLAVRWGYDGIEFRQERSGEDESPEQYLDAIAHAVDRTKLRFVLFGGPGPDLMQAEAGARRRELDEMVHFYRAACSRFELTVCNTFTGTLQSDAPYFEFDKNGSAIATDAQFAAAVEGFQVLGDLADELGFRYSGGGGFGYNRSLLSYSLPATRQPPCPTPRHRSTASSRSFQCLSSRTTRSMKSHYAKLWTSSPSATWRRCACRRMAASSTNFQMRSASA